MGLLAKLFQNNKQLKVNENKLVNLFTPYFSSSVNPKLNDTFMSCVNTHAKFISMIQPVPYLKEDKAKPYLHRILSLKPNPLMEAGAFWEKVARNYWIDNNAFIFLEWDYSQLSVPLKAMWILDPTNMDLRMDEKTKEVYIKFSVRGYEMIASLDDIVHIARDVDTTDIFGSRDAALNKVIQVINTNYEGIENAIKNSQFLRFIINTTTLLKDEDRKKKAEDFAKTYLSKDGTGIAYLDASSTLTQVNSQAKYANADEMKVFEEKIHRYMNMSEKILTSSFTAEEYQAYYMSNVQPFIQKLTNELTAKIYTDKEIALGNRIHVNANILRAASTQTKVNLIRDTKELGIFTQNEIRAFFDLDSIDDGDKRLVSLNYINALEQDKYQLQKKESKNE